MKTIHASQSVPVRPLLLVGAALAVFALGACSERERDDLADKTATAVAESKAAAARTWADVKSYTFEKRSEFELKLKSQQAQLEADVSRLRAEYSSAEASASRKAALEELKSSEVEFKEKLAALGTATADTWDATRDQLAASWDRLQAAYAKARAEK